MKKILLLLIICFASIVLAETFILDNGFGTYTPSTNSPNATVEMNIVKGWNLIPISTLANASGRYWGLYEENYGICSQDIFSDGVYYYSPRLEKYHKLDTIEDYLFVEDRGDSVLISEFTQPHFQIFGGSVWVYSKEHCLLRSDQGSLYAQSYASPGDLGYYATNGLQLEPGWNFVAVTYMITAYERSMEEIFDGCGATKFNIWNPQIQDWEYSSTPTFSTSNPNVTSPLKNSQIYSTIVINTTKSCPIMENIATGGSSSPPALPQSTSETTISTSDYTTSQNLWAKTEPWAITLAQSYNNEEFAYIDIKNNTSSTLVLESVTFGKNTYDTNLQFEPNISVSITPNMDAYPCENGYFKIPKQDITFKYTTADISGRTQVANADIIGTCS